jgi:hypothetical protein
MQDFEQQRREAEERVKEMNRSYRQKAGLDQNKPQEKPMDTSVTNTFSSTRRPVDILKLLRLDSLKGDPDRLLLIGVFLLLSGEEADELLLYALLYIML